MTPTNKQFCERDEVFKLSCELAKTKPTKRQASKFRMGKGSAINFKKQAIELVKKGGEE